MKLTIIIAINPFVSSINFRNRADKALTEKSSERRALQRNVRISYQDSYQQCEMPNKNYCDKISQGI